MSSSNAAQTDQPEAYPRRMQLLEQDQKTTYDGLAKLEADASVQVQNKRFLPDNSFLVDVKLLYPKDGNGQGGRQKGWKAVESKDSEAGSSGKPDDSNVVPLLRDWLGPQDELVPFGRAARDGRPPDDEVGSADLDRTRRPPRPEDFWG